ncbi:MAG TPA: hypothetical protein DEH78_04045 [Solibacterales bacterium]|nr:hypothetical protein [Bryobacterales bacterium]
MHRRLLLAMVLGGVFAGATALLVRLPLVEALALKTYDLHFVLRGARPVPDVVLIAADEESLRRIKDPLLFWHPHYAAAMRASAAAGAKAFALDVHFALPVTRWEPEHDRLLTEALLETSASMPVVCGFLPESIAGDGSQGLPLYMVAAASGMIASLQFRLDSDGYVRSLEAGDDNARALSFKLAEMVFGRPAAAPANPMRVNFAGPAGTVSRVSLADFLDAARAQDNTKLARWVKDKIVLLGFDTATSRDRHATPFYTVNRDVEMAGIEIHASAVDTILRERYLLDPPAWVSLATLFAAGFLAALLGSFRGPAWWLVPPAVFGIAHAAFRAGWVLPSLGMPMSAFLAGSAAALWRLRARVALFRHAFGAFAGKEAREGLEQAGRLTAESSREEVTILVSDIKGFSEFCRDRDPSDIVRSLDAYLRRLASIVVADGGEVNKYLGDGLLCVFRGMNSAAAITCAEHLAAEPAMFETCVGLHSGPVVLGNIGSEAKMEYAVLGETVNVAVRLQALNREYGTRVLMSEATAARAEPPFAGRFLGEAVVRGAPRPVRVYSAGGDTLATAGRGSL